jgi:hypothetical protein
MFEALSAPFHPNELEWRIGQAGQSDDGDVWAKTFAYMDARAVQTRLDEVVGPENWANTVQALGDNTTKKTVHKKPSDRNYMQAVGQVDETVNSGFLSGVGIRIDGEWVWKYDGSGSTDYEALKGGVSGSIKRAVVLWGVGRYLYDLKQSYALIYPGGIYNTKTKIEGNWRWLRWSPPALPDWAVPDPSLTLAAMKEHIASAWPNANPETEVVSRDGLTTLGALAQLVKASHGKDYYRVLDLAEALLR